MALLLIRRTPTLPRQSTIQVTFQMDMSTRHSPSTALHSKHYLFHTCHSRTSVSLLRHGLIPLPFRIPKIIVFSVFVRLSHPINVSIWLFAKMDRTSSFTLVSLVMIVKELLSFLSSDGHMWPLSSISPH